MTCKKLDYKQVDRIDENFVKMAHKRDTTRDHWMVRWMILSLDQRTDKMKGGMTEVMQGRQIFLIWVHKMEKMKVRK